MTFKKITFNKKPRRIDRRAGARSKKANGIARDPVNRYDREQLEWARNFNHWKQNENN